MRTAFAPVSAGFGAPARRHAPKPNRPTGLSIQCRNRILFHEKEVQRGADGIVSVKLSAGDPRSTHARDVLKISPGDTLRVGILNDSPATAVVMACPSQAYPCAELFLTWRPGEESGDADTARRNLVLGGQKNGAAPNREPAVPSLDQHRHTHVQIDLLIAVPRPKVLRRLWAPLASLGVGRVFLTNASRVEKSFWDASSLGTETVERNLIKGLEQAGDVFVPGVTLVKRFPAVLDAIGVSGVTPKPESVTVLVTSGIHDGDASAKSKNQNQNANFTTQTSEQQPIMLVAHPGSCVSLRSALRGAGKDSWGYGPKRVVIAVGPEGGWSEFELETLKKGGFTAIEIGNRTFATDVACISLIAAVKERTETW